MKIPVFQNTSREIPVKEKVEPVVVNKTKYLPPDMAVRIAWGLTIQLSGSKVTQKEEKGTNEETRTKMLINEIRANVKTSNDEREKLYVDWVCSAIEAAYRDLATIMNGRNFNYEQIQKLRDKEMENIQYYSQFTTNLQSAVPRILGMTIGGMGGVVFLSKLLETFLPQNYAPQLSILAGAVIGYIANGLIITPLIHKKMSIKLIKLDYDTNLYYEHYIERSKKALIALYNTVEEIHMTIFKDFYDPEKTEQDVEIIVEKMFSVIRPTMCNKVGECIRNHDITPDRWSICETSPEDKNYCQEQKSWISRKFNFIKYVLN